MPCRFQSHDDQAARARCYDGVSRPFARRRPFTCRAAAHPSILKGKLKSQVTAIQQQRRNGGTNVAIVKSDDCVDFSFQRIFCQFFSCLRTHDPDLLQKPRL
ncbi:hypothetical protein IE4771_CH01881 [Rhizobium etli bv. mimosae str. IE4771]|uniref:Uncharacterized protein n=1 Tax=Rhizobium etli bv. mimosae str. IE4771 TaxID=1432050 RepID=A0A060I521_RHIET|nr:hypothetical protein IE4771_CH01881 [Rhizobium sp. IE4771]